MKTRDLIGILNDLDPVGDMDVCVGNEDILFADIEPSYYDGCKQVLVRTGGEYYDVVGVKIIGAQGYKIVIHPHGVDDALLDNPDMPIEYDEYSERHYKPRHEKLRKEFRKIHDKINKGKRDKK